MGALRLLIPSLSLLLAKVVRQSARQHKKECNMPVGTVKFFNETKGFGFIQPDDGGQDAFVHITAVEQAGMRTLNKDQKVSYDLEQDQRGKTKAVNLQSA
jgi:CspA family cold shock protein